MNVAHKKIPDNNLAIPVIAQAPPKIHVLLIQEIPRRESSQLPEHIGLDDQTRASDPFHVKHGVRVTSKPDPVFRKQTEQSCCVHHGAQWSR